MLFFRKNWLATRIPVQRSFVFIDILALFGEDLNHGGTEARRSEKKSTLLCVSAPAVESSIPLQLLTCMSSPAILCFQ